MTVVDLDALASPEKARKVKLCGREVAVLPLSGWEVLRLAQMGGEGVENIATLYAVARAKVPDLTETEAQSLTMDQLVGIVGIAREQVEAVEQGNA